ncbi:hypothetical protein [Thermohalobacter berrensis]|uniref:Uncharacterized protein n=1 Tax=Thermohalobacter berrensis TaxID=99594 RepID=A0A419T128_9FIRM|nr:hypothetical protein [Thermohalobacter berrensis]RKD31280.1 hypothetical protein BET03_03895 [Thermohalobacter berrensis]
MDLKGVLNILIKISITFLYSAGIIGMIYDYAYTSERGFTFYLLIFIIAVQATMLHKKKKFSND